MVHQSFWIFHFSVPSEVVGLMIRRLDKVICKEFALFLSLWIGGGPDFILEKTKWDLEQDSNCTYVSRKNKKSYSQVVASGSSHSKLVFSRLSFPHSNYQNNSVPIFNQSSKKHAFPPVAKNTQSVPPLTESLKSLIEKQRHFRFSNSSGPLSCFRCLVPGHKAQFCSNDVGADGTFFMGMRPILHSHQV